MCNIENELNACLNCKNPTCVSGCPANNNIPKFIELAKKGDLEEAFKVIKSRSFLPSICSLVCPFDNQCMGHCIKNKMGKPVNIPKIEQYIASNVKEKVEPINKNNYKVAIIGSGPAGISCGEELALKGYNVDIYDKYDIPGGILSYGIPEFVLPKEKVNEKIDYLKKLGINFIMNKELNKDIYLDELKEKYDAIFLGFGASIGKKMGYDNENIEGVIDANLFLERMYRNEFDTTNVKDIIVVGGGNTAIDAALVAKYNIKGSNVSIVYRRSIKEMPARMDEINKVIDSGVNINFLCNPIKYIGEGKIKEIECIKMELVANGNDRPRPVPIKDSNFIIKADLVVLAISSGIDKNLTSSLDCESWGGIIVNEKMQTSDPKVFAGGDCVRGPSFVVNAMVDGKKAGIAIDEYLNKKE